MKNDPTLKKWFRTFNKRYFDGTLPNCVVFWEPAFVTGDELGEVKQEGERIILRIDPSIRFTSAVTKLVLLHEMSHLRLWPYLGHGRKFQAEMLRLAALGAFKNLW